MGLGFFFFCPFFFFLKEESKEVDWAGVGGGLLEASIFKNFSPKKPP